MKPLINLLKKNPTLRMIGRTILILNAQYHYNPLNWIRSIKDLIKVSQDYRDYSQQNDNPHFQLTLQNWLPITRDKTTFTPIDPVYFLQDTWAANKIFQLKPKHHYDIGSSVITMGILSQFVPVTMIDIRPIDIELENLFFQKGSILDLPFADNSIESLSSLCVIEHIGLGRYGDSLDAWGSEKAIQEIKRVVCPQGIVLFSVPIDQENQVIFNAHRTFTRNYILELFAGFELLEEKYQYGQKIVDHYQPEQGFGTGLYLFRKK